MATRLDLQNKVFRWLDDKSDGSGRWTTQAVQDGLDAGQLDFCVKTGILKDLDTTVALTADNDEATLPSDVIEVSRVELGNGSELRLVTEEQLDLFKPGWRSAAAGTPAFWMHNKRSRDKIALYPKPDAAAVALGNLRIYHTRKPVALAADGDVPEIPEEYHDALAYFALHQCLFQNHDGQDLNGAAAAMGDYSSMVALAGGQTVANMGPTKSQALEIAKPEVS